MVTLNERAEPLAVGADIEPGLARGAFDRYVKFCLVGGLGVGVDMTILYALASPRGLGWSPLPSKIMAGEAAMLFNFALNELWTFHKFSSRAPLLLNRAIRLAKFNGICAAGLAMSALLLYTQTKALGMNLYLANLVAIGAVSVWNFVLTSRFGWRTQPNRE